MDGIVLGMAMLVSSTAGLPAVEIPRVAPSTFTFNLPDAPAMPMREQSRQVGLPRDRDEQEDDAKENLTHVRS